MFWYAFVVRGYLLGSVSFLRSATTSCTVSVRNIFVFVTPNPHFLFSKWHNSWMCRIFVSQFNLQFSECLSLSFEHNHGCWLRIWIGLDTGANTTHTTHSLGCHRSNNKQPLWASLLGVDLFRLCPFFCCLRCLLSLSWKSFSVQNCGFLS